MSGFRFIDFKQNKYRAEITLNRPPLNMLNTETVEEFVRALEDLRDDDSLKLLVLRGANHTFCSGIEPDELQADRIGLLMPSYTRIFAYLNQVRGLTLCIAEGEAVNAGCEIASFCDVMIASSSARFGFPMVSMGLFPPIATAVLPRLIGRNRTLDRVISGELFSAQDAYRADLVARVVPDDELEPVVGRYIARIDSLSAPAILLGKRAVDEALYTPVMEALRTTESTYMLDLMGSIDPHEGIKATLDGRQPVWRNR